jgi:hypothetical protein
MGVALTIEEELEKRGGRSSRDEVAKDLWPRYQTMKSYLGDSYYRFIQANCRWYTDHGERHINSVIETASRLLARQPEGKNKDDEAMSSLDLFLVLTAILWHDVGNVVKRSGHAEQIPEMAEKIKGVFPNVAVRRVAEDIARAHSGKEGLKIPRADETCSVEHRSITVYPRSMAAVVRLADEVSENQTRISAELLPQVPPESLIFWEYANCISSSVPDLSRERVVVTYDIPANKVRARYQYAEFPARAADDGTISLIQYIVCRLEKMNNERVYCLPYMRYGPIRSIEARFTLLKGTRRLPSHDGMEVTFGDRGVAADVYPEIAIFDQFFAQNQGWRPAKLEEELKK